MNPYEKKVETTLCERDANSERVTLAFKWIDAGLLIILVALIHVWPQIIVSVKPILPNQIKLLPDVLIFMFVCIAIPASVLILVFLRGIWNICSGRKFQISALEKRIIPLIFCVTILYALIPVFPGTSAYTKEASTPLEVVRNIVESIIP